MGRTSVEPLSVIVAVDLAGGFAKDFKIPWNYPEDLKHFKETTMGNPCIMGRHTYEEIVEKHQTRQQNNIKKGKQVVSLDYVTQILPGRDCFVVSSNNALQTPGATRVPNIRKAINSLDSEDTREVFVIGGFRLFVEGLSWANKVYMTIVQKRCDCDRFFPIHYLNKNFKIVEGRETKRVQFVTYERIKK